MLGSPPMRTPLFFLGLTSIIACGGEEEPKLPTFTRVQAEVLTVSCSISSSCHVGNRPAGELALTAPSYANLVNVEALESPGKMLVKPGDPDNSYLMDKLLDRGLPTSTDGTPWTSMPPGSRLDQARIDLVHDWIAAGAKDD
jgi:hypothetical protein